jgi:hypothetical protein
MGRGRQCRRALDKIAQSIKMLFAVGGIKPPVARNKRGVSETDRQQYEQVCVQDERLAHAQATSRSRISMT